MTLTAALKTRKLGWLLYGIHREPEPPGAGAEVRDSEDDYDSSFTFWRALAPTLCLLVVGACVVAMLNAVHYLSLQDELGQLDKISAAIGVGEVDIAARRAALAYSGVILAITCALSVASVVWTWVICLNKAVGYRICVFFWVVFALGLSIVVVLHSGDNEARPFTSILGQRLLDPGWLPGMLFFVAAFVPASLACGAGLLLQPMSEPIGKAAAERQLRVLDRRLGQLDKLLYIGALALVFGTLQLSAALSVPLASMPKVADLKNDVELCKMLIAASPVSSSTSRADRTPARKAAEDAVMDRCRQLPAAFDRSRIADSLRQFIRGLTLSFGLAFSALLAAIYTPGLILLQNLAARPHEAVDDANSSASSVGAAVAAAAEPGIGIGDVDPLQRIAAIVATLSPLIAGLLANALATS